MPIWRVPIVQVWCFGSSRNVFSGGSSLPNPSGSRIWINYGSTNRHQMKISAWIPRKALFANILQVVVTKICNFVKTNWLTTQIDSLFGMPRSHLSFQKSSACACVLCTVRDCVRMRACAYVCVDVRELLKFWLKWTFVIQLCFVIRIQISELETGVKTLKNCAAIEQEKFQKMSNEHEDCGRKTEKFSIDVMHLQNLVWICLCCGSHGMRSLFLKIRQWYSTVVRVWQW